MRRTDLACVLGIVVEIFLIKQTVFVSDKSVGFNGIGVKFKLEFDILCDRIILPKGFNLKFPKHIQ